MITRRTPAPASTPAIGEGKRGTQGHIAYLLRQASAAARLALDSGMAEVGLTSPQFLVLNLLDAYAGISGAELARLTQLTPQTINLVVRKLERDAWIARAQHESHGRVLRLQPTPAGRRVLARCKRIADRTEQRMLDLLDARSEAAVRAWLVEVARTLPAAAHAGRSSARARKR